MIASVLISCFQRKFTKTLRIIEHHKKMKGIIHRFSTWNKSKRLDETWQIKNGAIFKVQMQATFFMSMTEYCTISFVLSNQIEHSFLYRFSLFSINSARRIVLLYRLRVFPAIIPIPDYWFRLIRDSATANLVLPPLFVIEPADHSWLR